MDCAPYHRALGVWVIGVYKLAKSVVLLAAGCFTLHLAQSGGDGGAAHLGVRLGLVPGHSYVRMAIGWLGSLDQTQLEELGAAIILYGLLYVAQSVGLLLRRRWGAYLVIVSTGFFIPVEVYEAARRFDLTRVGILVLNLAVVAYLVHRLRCGSSGGSLDRECSSDCLQDVTPTST